MGITQQHSFGRSGRFYLKEEATPGTYEKPGAANSMRVRSFSPTVKPMRKDEITSYMSSRDVISRLQGRTELSWALDAEVIPSGVKTTPPDYFPLVKALLGTQTIGANSVVISQSSSQVLSTLTMLQQVENLQRALWGCVVDQLSLKVTGTETPRINATGKAMGYAFTGYGVLDKRTTGSITAFADAGGGEVLVTSATHELTTGQSVTITGTTNYNGTFTVTVVTADTFKITVAWVADDGTGTWEKAVLEMTSAYYNALMVNSLVQVGTDDNGGAGFLVTSTDGAGTHGIEAVAGAADGASVVPFVPTFTPNGTPTTGLVGTLTWDSGSLVGPMTAFDLMIKSGNTYVEDGCFQEFMSDAIIGVFEITGTIGIRLRKDLLLKILDREAYTPKALAVTMGGAAQSGTRTEISLPQCEQEHADFEIPESAEVTFNFPFKALGSSGDDAITWTGT